jgi:uncharacterized membrane protein (UPF0136 family)
MRVKVTMQAAMLSVLSSLALVGCWAIFVQHKKFSPAILLALCTLGSLYAYRIWKAPLYMLLLGIFFTAMIVVFLGFHP